MEENPSVSWLMCAHIADSRLRDAISSCLNQTYRDFELVVVCNGENANSVANKVLEWSCSDGRLRLITTNIRHLSFSLSLGLHYSRAPLVARMDSDDISALDRLEKQVEYMNSNPDIVVLGSDYELVDMDGVFLSRVTLPKTNGEIRSAFYFSNPICHPSVIFRRSEIEAAGGYLGGIYAEDYDLWVRVAENPLIKFANLSDTCIKYRAVGIGNARKSRLAYSSVASSQFRIFLNGGGVLWGIAAFVNSFKVLFRSRP